MLNEGLAFFGEAVFLQAAVGFIGDGALDEAGFKRWEQVGFPEVLTICKIKSCLKLFSGVFRYDNLKKSSDLRVDLRVDLRGYLRGDLRLCEREDHAGEVFGEAEAFFGVGPEDAGHAGAKVFHHVEVAKDAHQFLIAGVGVAL